MNKSEHVNICDTCGGTFINFCVSCAKAQREEMVEELMDKFGLTVETLISELSIHVLNERNFAALKTALDLKSMKPVIKADITSGGKPLMVDDAVRERLLTRIRKITDTGSAD
jgi:hypothetical protein